jgi:hypothetical protein
MDIIKVFNIKELAQEFVHSPKIEMMGADIILMFDYETDTGEYKWTGITFKNALEYKHTNENEVDEELLKAYNSVVEVKNSIWLKQVISAKGNIENNKLYKHFLVYFDGYGAYEFVSSDVAQGVI